MLTTEINIKLQYQKAIVANMSPFDVNTHCQRLLVQLVCAEKSHVNQKTQRYRAEKKQKQSILAMKSFCQLQRQVLEQIQLAIEHGKVEIIEAEYRPFIKELQKYLDDILPQPEDYLCSICLCVYYLPITLTTCRHTFCKSCLKLYMSRKIENLKEAEYQEFTSQHQSTSLFSSNCTLVDQPTPHPPLFDCPVCRTAFDTTTYQTDVALDNLLSLYFPEEQKQRRVDTLGLFSTWWTSAFLKYPPKTKKRSKKVDRDMKDFQCSFRSSHPILHLLFGNQMWGVYRENLTNGQQRRSSHSRFMSAEETAYYNDLTLAQGMVFLSV
ncbi:hypothetical protein BDF14DRAFT_1430729 [Spinellus fusiger]|nr:hypothetical protein BDF14DRAFT_1430729 [Spinellus fusiger]